MVFSFQPPPLRFAEQVEAQPVQLARINHMAAPIAAGRRYSFEIGNNLAQPRPITVRVKHGEHPLIGLHHHGHAPRRNALAQLFDKRLDQSRLGPIPRKHVDIKCLSPGKEGQPLAIGLFDDPSPLGAPRERRARTTKKARRSGCAMPRLSIDLWPEVRRQRKFLSHSRSSAPRLAREIRIFRTGLVRCSAASRLSSTRSW